MYPQASCQQTMATPSYSTQKACKSLFKRSVRLPDTLCWCLQGQNSNVMSMVHRQISDSLPAALHHPAAYSEPRCAQLALLLIVLADEGTHITQTSHPPQVISLSGPVVNSVNPGSERELIMHEKQSITHVCAHAAVPQRRFHQRLIRTLISWHEIRSIDWCGKWWVTRWVSVFQFHLWSPGGTQTAPRTMNTERNQSLYCSWFRTVSTPWWTNRPLAL